jgi:hypothetical protein
LPALLASFSRLALIAVPTLWLIRLLTFELRWIWSLSVAVSLIQLGIVSLLPRRELQLKLRNAGDAGGSGVSCLR